MILLLGPAGAGKSVQSQLLAVCYGLKWLSAGRLLRAVNNPQITDIMTQGELVPPSLVNQIVFRNLDDCDHLDGTILDGYPRSIDQAKALSHYGEQRCNEEIVKLVIVLDVSSAEVFRRLAKRGRLDDAHDVVEHRLEGYRSDTLPILDYYAGRGAAVVHIDGEGSRGEVLDRVVAVYNNYQEGQYENH